LQLVLETIRPLFHPSSDTSFLCALYVAQCTSSNVHRLAERLAFQYTAKRGHRSFDVLHVATALHLGAKEFLAFDANQKKLAEA